MKHPIQPLVLALCFALAPSLGAQPTPVKYSPPARSVPIGSTFVDWDKLSFRPGPVGLFCPIFDDPTPALEKLEVHVTMLRPGMASHAPHRHPWEEILLIKEGQVEVSINGRTQGAGPGSLVFLASNDAHNLTNTGTTLAAYYVINFCTAAVHTVRDQPAAEWAPPGMLSSRVVDCDSLPRTPTKTGFHNTAFNSPTVTFLWLESHVTVLNPGEGTTPRNRDPGDEIFVVRSGAVEATVNGNTHLAGAGSLFYVAPNDERTMRNPGGDPCSYQVIKVVSDKSPPRA
jgi:quercetin dioxygenase-like cupin family protein